MTMQQLAAAAKPSGAHDMDAITAWRIIPAALATVVGGWVAFGPHPGQPLEPPGAGGRHRCCLAVGAVATQEGAMTSWDGLATDC
jgi:hypothetical protein